MGARPQHTSQRTPGTFDVAVPLLAVAAVTSAATWFAGWPWPVPLVAVGLAGLAVLSKARPGVERGVDAVFKHALLVLAVWIAVLAPAVLARAAAEAVVGAPPVLAAAVLLAWIGAFGVALTAVATDHRRRQVWEGLSPLGRGAPFLYALALAEIAVVLFATLAVLLVEAGAIRFGTGPVAADVTEPADALDFFAWHLLDAIPALQITSTMRWGEPLGYEDAGVGLLVLTFKVAVIAPIVAAFVSFWRFRRAGETPQA